MGRRGKVRIVERGNQESARNADRFRHIIILLVIAGIGSSAPLPENHDQPRRNLKTGFDLVGAARRGRVQPFIARLGLVEIFSTVSAALRMAVFFAADEMTAKCQGWWFASLGAEPVARIACSMTSRETGASLNWRQVRRVLIA